MKTARIVWQGKLAFAVATGSGHSFITDARPEVGGEGRGPLPAELVLVGLIGCTGIDVVSILNKMRVPPERLELSAEGDEQEEHPRRFSRFRITYHVDGDVPAEKLERAIKLSRERYCVVANLVGPVAPIDLYYVLNGAAPVQVHPELTAGQ